jgi:hypothetical protein
MVVKNLEEEPKKCFICINEGLPVP